MKIPSDMKSPGLVTEAVWRRLDRPGHDVFRLSQTAAGWLLQGTAIGMESAGPYALEYEVHCDPSWRSLDASITGWSSGKRVDLSVAAVDDGAWLLNGTELRSLTGCTDIDLAFTPATNTIALRRLNLAQGRCAASHAAWLMFPDLRMDRLDQMYRRIDASTYHYAVEELSFETDITVDEHLVVEEYPGLWSRVRPPAAPS